jgi:hypothetical protein
LIPVIDGMTMSHALHGLFMPLRRSIGRRPQDLLRVLPGDWTCGLIKSCVMARPEICYPCAKMPHCYMPPDFQGNAALALATVLRAWVDGRYVLVVEGDEFSL